MSQAKEITHYKHNVTTAARASFFLSINCWQFIANSLTQARWTSRHAQGLADVQNSWPSFWEEALITKCDHASWQLRSLNPCQAKINLNYINIQSIPRSKHTPSRL